ncbi:MAG: VWA domain-containing protein [Edaphobacter sp.]|uniref:VWA domain-containing protein n=1 Tax=Edaphobacter sp. TaxID=1934404 RepID=UPI002398974B|nr:VWA domain-containing protein [Edaphobacter sp.]MDE1177609.1 VWA domain-containing protein [Edaphobacter sp.]
MLAGLLLGGAFLLQAPIVRRPPMPSVDPDADQQQQQTPSNQNQVPTLKVETRLVNIAVNVVDKTGAPVGGLQQGDFEIVEDGKVQKISYFERESTTPLSIVLAIDGSESVQRNESLEKQAAKKFVNTLLRDQDELDLMDFSDTVREIVPFTNQKKRIESGLGEIEHGAATALYDAIYLASERLSQTRKDAGRRRVLVLITDGSDTAKRSRYAQALEEAQRAGAMIYSIIIVPIWADAGRDTGGEHALVQMSNDTGGKYFYVEDKSDLAPAFAQVSDDLRTQYVLGYYAPQRGRDSSFRTVKVRMKDPALREKYDLRHRSGYFADGR